MDKPLALLNNLTPSQFLAEYWQKKPLLIRNALPDFNGLLSPNELAGLACEEDVQARIVSFKKSKWAVKNSPLDEDDFTKLPKNGWTLLVQNVNHYLPEASDLLALFNFIPHARLDDLMVSYAPEGSGIGAHVDSYDVFLLQGAGKRNWKISAPSNENPVDLSLVENAPLKILKNFKAKQEWTLEAGDMLYLPPQIAHWGVSESDDCMTYSIGFRAPKTQELMHEFLNYLQDNIHADGLYADADLALQKHPAEISSAMVKRVSSMLQALTWDKQQVADFLGRYLTEPKLDVMFTPAKKISKAEFTKRLATKTLWLSLKSQLLFTHDNFYLNGEKLVVPAENSEAIKHLADKKYLNVTALQSSMLEVFADTLYEAFSAGYICFK
jgi:50S ribosomal protein L16 3-hydroxylase